jgi:glutamate/tyrosine decarboxylase-like PLP-dependent enzyme
MPTAPVIQLDTPVPPPIEALPAHGTPNDPLIRELAAMRRQDVDWEGGRCFALVYHAGAEHQALLRDASGMFLADNGLNPMAFKSLKRMEAEVVKMTARLLHGPASACGTMTSGGTESLLLAMLAYRERARRKKPWILRPEVVLPETAHVAFEKAAHLFGLKLRRAPMDDQYRADLKAMKRLIGPSTILLVGSAPQYPHGAVDPIEEIGELAERHNLPLHVDACVGGFMLPFVEKLGEPVPAWDFRVPGVTSISADLHKYGYAAKGASVLVYRRVEDLKHQFFIATDWCGGIYASPTIAGTRPGGPIAAAWAGLRGLGEDGYLELTRRALAAKKQIVEGIRAIDGVRVLGQPPGTVIAFASSDPAIDIYAVADQLSDRGWHFDRQQSPPSVHLTIMAAHLDSAGAFLDDLAAAVQAVRSNPELKSRGDAAMYGMMAKLPVRTAVKLAVSKIMEGMYGPEGKAPDLSAGTGLGGGPLGAVVERYLPKAMGLIDRFDQTKTKVARALGRRTRG